MAIGPVCVLRSACYSTASTALGGEVIATFENEPGHLNALLDDFPAAAHVRYGHVHSPDAPPPRPEIHHIESFRLA